MKKIINKIVETALSYKGTPYLWAGTNSEGMDCSGLVVASFKAGGISVPRIAGDQAKIGPPMELDELEPGDLVFFTDKVGNTAITHVGIITQTDYKNNSTQFIHASSSKGVMESELLSGYWRELFLTATRPSAFIA